MRPLAGLLDRLVLLLAVYAGGLLPSFILQYRQRMQGRLDQLQQDLAPFQTIADRLHGGDLGALIRHHRGSGDATFVAEAEAILQMQQQAGQLRDAVNAMQGDLARQLFGWLGHLDRADLQATWQIYLPQFPLDAQGLGFALGFGALVWLLWVGAAALLARWFTRSNRARPHFGGGRH